MCKATTAAQNKAIGFARRATRPMALVGVGMCAVLWWGGCSVEKNYKVLSFFFDGVPDPNAPDRYDGRAIAESPTYSEHQPYSEEGCLECHVDPSDMSLSVGDASMCTKCHEDIADQHSYMHGAVLGGACLMCHNPHFSALQSLLRDDGPGMCVQCHDLEVDGPNMSHSDLERSCIDCHSGHGGDSPFFLRDLVESEAVVEQEKQEEPGQTDSSTLEPEGEHGP